MYVRMLGRERLNPCIHTSVASVWVQYTHTHVHTHVHTPHTHTCYVYLCNVFQAARDFRVILFPHGASLWSNVSPLMTSSATMGPSYKGVATSYSKWHQCCDVAQSPWLQRIPSVDMTNYVRQDNTSQTCVKWSQMVVKATIIAMHVRIPRSPLCCCLHYTKVTAHCTSDGNQFVKH